MRAKLQMTTKIMLGALLLVAVLAAFPPAGFAGEHTQILSSGEETIRGKIISTEMTLCGTAPGKPGTCEGTLVLESSTDGTPRQVTFRITRDTILRHGERKLFLPQLEGRYAVITFVRKKGENIAKSVVMA
jgi:hypothetical protein